MKPETSPSIAAGKALPTAFPWRLGGLALSMLLSSLGTSIANVALPDIATAFGASFQDVQWIVLAYLLAVTTLIVSVGRLGDLFGRRRLLLLGLGLFTFASLLCALASTLWLLIAARALQGLGAAFMMALTTALVGESVPKEKTGSAMGMLGTMQAIGTALGPSLGGMLLAGFGWPAIFLINLPLGILAVIAVAIFLPADHVKPAGERGRLDKTGTLLLAATLGAYALAMTIGKGQWDIRNMGLLVAALIGLGLFILVETRTSAPLLKLSLLADRGLATSLATSGLVATVMMATLVVGPFYLARSLGLGAALVGIVMSVGPLISTVTGLPAGRLVDRWGARQAMLLGLCLMVVGAGSLALIPGLLGVAGYIAAIAVLTPGYQLFQAANNTGVMMGVDPAQRGVIAGTLSLSRNLGLITGAAAMGAIFAAAAGTSDITLAEPAAIAHGLRVAFGVAAGLIALALGLAASSPKK